MNRYDRSHLEDKYLRETQGERPVWSEREEIPRTAFPFIEREDDPNYDPEYWEHVLLPGMALVMRGMNLLGKK